MADESQHPAPSTSAPTTRSWRPTFGQVRLGILLSALLIGISGMTRNDPRMINAGIVIAMIGVILRFVGPYLKKGA